MEPENSTPAPDASITDGNLQDPPSSVHDANAAVTALDAMSATPESAVAPQPGGPEPEESFLHWVFIGPQGLRAGWSVAIFLGIFAGVVIGLRAIAHYMTTHSPLAQAQQQAAQAAQNAGLSPWQAMAGEGIGVLFLLGVLLVMALIERRNILDYNLRGPKRRSHFVQGLAVGFLSLSVLVGGLAAGGWLHFNGMALSGGAILLYAAAWGVMFFLVGCMEEGMFRCYLQFTLARGINFWWALACVGALCADLAVKGKGNGIWGVFIMAGLGLIPCLWLYVAKRPGNGFWQAAWVTSTAFGFLHTGNGGENWIGIFSAGAVGAVFCVSIRLTGSAWWAIGCHASWDWAQTYFYGVADSGMVARGHLLTTAPAGAALWSGGADGPEGSILILPVLLILLAVLIALYGRRRAVEPVAIAAEQPVG